MKRIILPVAALTALILAACQPMPQNDPVSPAQQAEAACTARGGELKRVGRLQSIQCVVSYPDAGQRCTDSDDCQGDCRIDGNSAAPAEGAAVVGQCQQTNMSFGCFTRVEDGKADATLCID